MSLRAQLQYWRFWLVAALFIALPLLVIWRASNLLSYGVEASTDAAGEREENFLKAQGDNRTVRPEPLVAYRGVISDRHGNLLAVSTPVESLVLNPKFVNPEQVPDIAKAVGMSAQELSERLDFYRNKQYMVLASELPPYQANLVMAHNFSGLSSETIYKRFYPAGEVAAHVVGVTSREDVGVEGIELSYERWLKGEPGAKKVLKDRNKKVIKELGLIKSPVSGKDLQLTIDLKLQYIAYRELKEAVYSSGAKSASLVMVEVESGEILAVANLPSYNPNDLTGADNLQMRNRAVTDVFEPGSTVKPFTIMAALDSGMYRPHDTVDTSPGWMMIGQKTIKDPVNYQRLDLGGIIKKSSQVGVSKIALKLQPEQIHDAFFKAGFGQSTGIGFPGEKNGSLPNRTRWTDIQRANFAFGYGLSINAMQLAQAYLTLANDGVHKPLSLVRGSHQQNEERVFDERSTRDIVAMLKTVTQTGGTATSAQIHEYPVAGKTGTAEVLDEGGGYNTEKNVALFAGFAPADNPKIVTVVVVNEPGNLDADSGGKAAAPIFAQVVEKSLRILNVLPQNTERFIGRVGVSNRDEVAL